MSARFEPVDRLRRLLVVSCLAAPAACTAAWYTEDADEDVGEVLREFEQQSLADRAGTIVMPEVVPPPPPEEPTPEGEAAKAPAEEPAPAETPEQPPLLLDLAKTLQLAVTQSRTYLDQKENLYLAGLGFTFTRFNYGPQFSSAVGYLWGDGDGIEDTSSASASIGVSQLLPTNGTLAVSGGLVKSFASGDNGANDDWSTSTSISLSQPLLRGGGYDLYREALTQGERNMVYAVRSFELFREDFTIESTDRFFGLLALKRKLANNEADLQQAKFDEEKFTALKTVGRALDKDVINARRSALNAESALEDARTSYRRAVERFLIDLGLDPRTPVELVDTEPPYEIVTFEPNNAVVVAMHNRLDVQTRRDQAEDAERQFRLARNNLLPDVNLTASYGSGGSGKVVDDALPSTWNRAAGVSIEIPLQTIDRRNAWRQAEIAIVQTRRDWDLFVDNIKSGVEDQIRQLANTERQVEISTQSISDEEDNLWYLGFRVEQGTAEARDLTDARQNLVNQKNALIDLKVQHLNQQLLLYRNLGILFIAGDGSWRVGAP
jgi:outer membrane protein TolC